MLFQYSVANFRLSIYSFWWKL